MPGMGGNNVTLSNSLVLGIFHHSIYVTSVYWIIALTLVILLGASLTRRINLFNLSTEGLAEPRSRTYLRIAFGVIWLFDGILQFQAGMPLGLGNDIVKPTVSGAPWFLQSMMLDAIHLWNTHPIALATGTAWIQVGIGLALIVSNGKVGRVAGAAAVGWGSLIWLIGNGAGGAFVSGSSILFGWPGAPLFYVIAGVWLACTPSFFRRHFSRVTLRVVAVIIAVGALVQVLPSGEFWHGGNTNGLTDMANQMAATPQPVGLAWIVRHVGSLAGTLGGGFNVVVLLWLVACAVGLWMVSTRRGRWPIVTLVAGALVVWIVVQDVPIFGGLSTDVNSMIPLAVLVFCASPALREAAPLPRRLPEEFRSSSGAVVAAFATSMILFSVVSMGLASVASAEPTLFVAQNGTAQAINIKARVFTLTDQHNQPYTLGEHKGHYTLMTFLDPVCWTDCPLLAAQLMAVRAELPSNAAIDLVAVAANPDHQTLAEVRHFIKIHDLGSVKDFHFVTGPVAATKVVWKNYGITVKDVPGDEMSVHSDYMFIITPKGRLRWVIPDSPVRVNSVQQSSVSEIVGLLHQSGLG